ncbi:MAG TPA: Sll0314/Alr1548 family TPR repeat-containing protein [Candidatus Sericytochromatia bacterium]|jgi:tetratricopeptide (TPR) repeat protein
MTTWFPAPKRTVKALASAAVVLLGIGVLPTLAADPFRTSNARPIGKNTEAAFNSIFKEGDYKGAKRYLNQAASTESNEPLAHAMQAALAFTDGDLEGLNRHASKTLQTAQQLTSKDPLRGNLYTAVGHFLAGAYDIKKPGGSTGGALIKLQKVIQYLDDAKKVDPNDPELNLLSGYMDLMLAVNLPFSDPAQAIQKIEKYGSPSYLAYRGIAVGYRDMKQYSKAMEFVDRALAATPNNPEVLYLKAQILVRQGNKQQALEFFKKALEKQAQLPKESAAQITYEQCRAQISIDNSNRDCKAEKDKVRQRVD